MTVPTRVARPLWFVAVGCIAAGVHWLVVVALVEAAGWHPLVANVAGWSLALIVSFGGHHRLTFRGHGAPVARSAMRFVLVSAAGFGVNETVYALSLGWSRLGYQSLLAIVLALVAVMTWLLSRHWVFRGSSAKL